MLPPSHSETLLGQVVSAKATTTLKISMLGWETIPTEAPPSPEGQEGLLEKMPEQQEEHTVGAP